MNGGRTFESKKTLAHRQAPKACTAFGAFISVLGIFVVLAPLFMGIAKPLETLGGMTYVLTVFFVAGGIIDIVFASKLRPGESWGWLLFSGIVSIVMGALIAVQWPVSGSWALGLYVGIRILTHGWVLMALGRKGRLFRA